MVRGSVLSASGKPETGGTTAGWVLTLATAAVVIFVVAPTPVHLSYVTSDSMEPTLNADDGYLVVGWTTVQRGDIITFRSPERAEYVTHRVVERTDDGFITQGDANPSTDQAGGAPPVERSQVLGEVVTVGGNVLTVPHLGRLASVLSSPWILAIAGVFFLWYAFTAWTATVPARPVTHVGEAVVPLMAAFAVAGLLLLALAGSTHFVSYTVVTEGANEGTTLVVGEPATRNFTVRVDRSPMTTMVTDTEGMASVERTMNGSTVDLVARIPPPSEPGRYTAAVDIQPYPATLPRAWLQALHGVHPVLAMVVSTGVAFVPAMFLYALLFDRKRPVRASTWRWLRRLRGEVP